MPQDAALLLVIDPLDDLFAVSDADRNTLTDALHLALRRRALHLITTVRHTGPATVRSQTRSPAPPVIVCDPVGAGRTA